jgi:hypothetical protein
VYREYKQSMSLSPALPMLYILFRTLVSIDTHTHVGARMSKETSDVLQFVIDKTMAKRIAQGAVLVSSTFESLVCCMPPETLATLFGI